jgi:hypothetical protein
VDARGLLCSRCRRRLARHHAVGPAAAGSDRVNLDEGPVTLMAPATLSGGSCNALADFFELFLRRAKSDAAATGLFPRRRKTVE